ISLAERYGRSMHEVLAGVADPAVESWAYVLAASYANGISDCERALELGRKIEVIAESVGFKRRWEEGVGVQGAAHGFVGDFAAPRDVSRRIHESALRGDPQTQVWGLTGEAHSRICLGDVVEGLRLAQASETCLSQKLGRPEKIFAHGVL